MDEPQGPNVPPASAGRPIGIGRYVPCDHPRMDEKHPIIEDDTRDTTEEPTAAPGDVLGLSRFQPRERARAPLDRDRGEANEPPGEANEPPEKDERGHVGSRDVTEGTTGGTGPDTGGTGVFRRRSGATGTDIGK